MSVTFADLGVSADVVRSLSARGITETFPIQAEAIPPALDGRDICGRAPTGSGKTIAFAIPVAARAHGARPGRPVALILAPTRELAAQIESEMILLLGPKGKKRVAAFYGGVGFGAQFNALRRGVDVAVACPGRLEDLIQRGTCDLSDVGLVVIDEADRMADMGFLPAVRRLLDRVRDDRQTLLFSATLDGEVDSLIRRYQQSPVRVDVGPREEDLARPASEHHWLASTREDRVGQAAEWIARHGSTVVFCRTKHGTDRLARQLVAAGVKAVPIHGGRTQAQRERALSSFAAGKAQALIATDVAARGIHVDDVACVIHFDLPATDKDYLHRSGRTGRAGASGVVMSLVTPEFEVAAGELKRALGQGGGPARGSGRGAPRRGGQPGGRGGASGHGGQPGGGRGGRNGAGRSRRRGPAPRSAA